MHRIANIALCMCVRLFFSPILGGDGRGRGPEAFGAAKRGVLAKLSGEVGYLQGPFSVSFCEISPRQSNKTSRNVPRKLKIPIHPIILRRLDWRDRKGEQDGMGKTAGKR